MSARGGRSGAIVALAAGRAAPTAKDDSMDPRETADLQRRVQAHEQLLTALIAAVCKEPLAGSSSIVYSWRAI